MSSVTAATTANVPLLAEGSVGVPAGSETRALLPEPMLTALAGADPLAMLSFFESKDQKAGVDDGTKKVEALQSQRHEALQQEQRAITQSIDAEKSRSFWDDLGGILGEVAKVASVIASLAAAVATCGAATPLAVLAISGAVLSTASFVDGEFHVLRTLGVNADAAGWMDAGMAVAGGLMSAGGAVAAGARAGGSVLSLVDRAGAVVGALGQVGQGVAAIESGQAQGRADQAAADQVAAEAQSDQSLRRMQVTIDDTRASDEASQRILTTIANTDAIQSDTALSGAAAVRG